MQKITRHPLYAKADALKRAFVADGFLLHDDGASPEVLTADWQIVPYVKPSAAKASPIVLEEHGEYVLRSELIAPQLPAIGQATGARLPLRAIVAGRAYNAADAPYADHLMIEGVFAVPGTQRRHLEALWARIARQVYGIRAAVALEPCEAGAFAVKATAAEGEEAFTLAFMGKATSLARALLGIVDASCDAWLFTIDVDSLVMRDLGLASRKELYSPLVTFLGGFEDDAPTFGDAFAAKVADVLRARGFCEYSGKRLYDDKAYWRMNMIMESWDLNNRGFFLQTPLGDAARVPTVRTPALEDALEENFKAGCESAMLFEVGQHFVPDATGRNPQMKASLAFGCYGPGMDKAAFRALVGGIFDALGISNHFFIPIDMAIPYDPTDCMVVLDEHMQYLGGNFGSLNKIALDRHGFTVPVFMANLELPALEAKAAEEFDAIPNELL